MFSESYRLISEEKCGPVEVLEEQENLTKPACLFIQGPYMGGGIVNKNNRLYPVDEMRREVENFIENVVNKKMATGELNHPNHANIDLERACHLITKLWEDEKGVWYGKSKVLTSTPQGAILKGLLDEGVAIGMSSRCLGQLFESAEGYNVVHNMKLVTIDAVANPSYGEAFVNGILESKQFVCEADGTFKAHDAYEKVEAGLSNLPRGNQKDYITQLMVEFIQSFNA